MDNYDKLYKQYQKASTNEEAKEFPAMDKVWTRLEDKLDAKVHKKKSKVWKKVAVAASLLLIMSVGYQLFNPNETSGKDNKNINEAEAITVTDSVKPANPQINTEKEIVSEKVVVSVEKANPVIRENASDILKEQMKQEPVGYHPKTKPTIATGSGVIITDSIRMDQKYFQAKKEKSLSERKSATAYNNRTIFDARSVQNEDSDKTISSFVPQNYAAKSVQAKADPLVVVDGKAIKVKKNQSYDETIRSGLTNLEEDEIDSIVVLPEPLYIINGVYYTEESLFGKKPTSPYAPLNKQEIESISILQGEKAIAAYGEKGAKGVVIIMTKNGKPAKLN